MAQPLGQDAARIEVVVAAEMKHSVLTIRPVALVRQPSGEATTTPVGREVVIDLKAGRKLTNGPDAIRIGETTTTVSIPRTAQALEIVWEPKNDKKDDPSNTMLVILGREPQAVVNGYIEGAPVK